MTPQRSSSDIPLAVSSGRSAMTSAPQNQSTAPINQNATGNREQVPKKRRKRNKKRKNNNAGGNGSQPGSGSQPAASQTNQNAPRAGGGQQPNQKPSQAKKSQQPQPANTQNQNKRPNLGIVSVPASQKAEPPILVPMFAKFNDLPLEVQKRIFEIAYCLTEYGQPEDWIYVSRKVREWIEPFIYDSIVLPEDFERNGHKRLELYERTFKSKPKEFYARNVQRVYTNNHKNGSSDFELELLRVCDNLVSLECWSYVRGELTNILKTKSWPKLETLCINLDLLPRDENTFRLPIFKYVTHLDISSEDPQLPSWESLKSLDTLTHMRVYMLVRTQADEYRLAMDQAHAIATEAQKCFPPNLKHFVILVPIDLIYYISSQEHKTPKDKGRWERMESLRLGTFDLRVMLGCSGDWDHWIDDGELSDVDEDGIEDLYDYAAFTAMLTRHDCPRDHLDGEEKDTWEDVELKDRARKCFLASQKK